MARHVVAQPKVRQLNTGRRFVKLLMICGVLPLAIVVVATFQGMTAANADPAGFSWTSRTSAGNSVWRSVAYGNGVFVAVANTAAANQVMTSANGVTWTARSSSATNDWRAVTFGDGLFVAVSNLGTGNRVMTSPNGITWTSRASAADNHWATLTYGNGVYVAITAANVANQVMTSTNGTTWTSRTGAVANQWGSVAYGGGVFVAVAGSGTGNRVMTSPDGVTWTSRVSAADNDWNSVTYGGGLFVAVAGTGTGNRVMTSSDGITWTSRTNAVDNSWQSVTYGGGLFVAVSADGTGNRVMTSADGITWTSRTSSANNAWISAAYGGGTFVAVAPNAATVMTSAEAPTVTSVSPSAGSTAGGTSVTVTGTGFVSGATVTIGGTACTSVVFASATSLSCTTPAKSAGAQNVIVTNPSTLTGMATGAFTYAAAPTVASVTPSSGSAAGGTAVTVAGTGFVSGATVTVGGAACTSVVFGSATSLTCTTPAGTAGAQNVVVTNPSTVAVTKTGGFTYAAITYSITYSGNGSTAGTVPSSGSYTAGGAAHTVSGNTGSLVKTDCSFAGWNTAADGSGTAYAASSSYSTSATATLYAQWTAVVTYSVTYAANGSTGGAAPTDSGAYAAGASVTVLGNTGTLVRTGYAWAGWNTAADGSGTSYAAAATPSMGSGNVTLYAMWTVVTYAVSYDANGATGGAVPADAGAYAAGATATVLGNTGTLARTGYTFDRWNTAPSGSGTSYAGGSSLAMGSADVTLYAKWTAVTYVVTYAANGATGGGVPADGSFTTGGSGYPVPGNTGALARTGFVFTGWNTAAGGSGSAYAPASSYATSAGVTLHAQWAVATFGVTYAVNGATAGSAPVDAGAYAAGASATVLSNSGSLARIGYAFATWNTAADGSGTAYAPGAALTMGSAGVTLYAQWTAVVGYSVTYNGNGSTGGSAPADGGSYASGATATIAASGSLARTGYSFAAWNTAADGSGTAYAGGSSMTMGSANVTLYAQWTAVTYAITYSANGATGGSVPSAGSYSTGGAALTVPGNSGALVNAGYTFAGWNTAADGSGSAFAEGSSYSTPVAATLYSQWTIIGTYAISFNGNGSTGGSVPASGSYTPGGTAYSVAGNTGSLVRAGYGFSGWNAATDGSGTAYATGASYSASSSATLHAQWTAGTYAIAFAGNGATGGSPPAGASFTTGGSAFAVPGNSGGLSRAGYTFAGWNSAADGSGTGYAAGSSLSPVVATTLFGQWTAVPVVTPTPSSSPTTAGSGSSSSSPTPSPSTAAISYSNLNPIPHAANPNIPAAGVPAGGSVVLEDGVPITVTVKPNAVVAPTSLIVSGSGFTMQVEGRSGTAAVAPTVTATGALVLYSVQPAPRASAFGPGVRTSPWKFGAAVAPAGSAQPMAKAAGTGFRPGSPVRFYILPSVDMGEITVDASGAFSGEVPVPMGIAPGAQTLQVNGYSPDGSVRSLSLGVEVRAPGTSITSRQARALVKFGHKSATLTKASKSRLRGLVRRTGKDGIVSVTAFARGKELTKKDRALSDARARHVASFLRKVGLKGSYSVRGVWVVGGPKVTGRRVSVVISYPRR